MKIKKILPTNPKTPSWFSLFLQYNPQNSLPSSSSSFTRAPTQVCKSPPPGPPSSQSSSSSFH